jgi:hypothetical protein
MTSQDSPVEDSNADPTELEDNEINVSEIPSLFAQLENEETKREVRFLANIGPFLF